MWPCCVFFFVMAVIARLLQVRAHPVLLVRVGFTGFNRWLEPGGCCVLLFRFCVACRFRWCAMCWTVLVLESFFFSFFVRLLVVVRREGVEKKGWFAACGVFPVRLMPFPFWITSVCFFQLCCGNMVCVSGTSMWYCEAACVQVASQTCCVNSVHITCSFWGGLTLCTLLIHLQGYGFSVRFFCCSLSYFVAINGCTNLKQYKLNLISLEKIACNGSVEESAT